jgi:hypothetical protein
VKTHRFALDPIDHESGGEPVAEFFPARRGQLLDAARGSGDLPVTPLVMTFAIRYCQRELRPGRHSGPGPRVRVPL